MKLGFILECTQGGADVQVCNHLVKMINKLYSTNIVLAPPATLGNKQKLIAGCRNAAHLLFTAEKCERVVILWDQDSKNAHGQENCLGKDRKDIFAQLQTKDKDKGIDIDIKKVALVGIKRELETWLIADERAVAQCIRNIKHPHPVGRINGAGNPEEVMDPKSWLSNVFRPFGISKYRDFEHAGKIIRCLPDFQRIKQCETFIRFVSKVSDVQL